MKVLAVGAAGSSAGLATRVFSERGIEVRGLVHAAERGASARDNGAVEVAVADLQDRTALARAVDGVDAVFHVLPAFVGEESDAGVALVETAAEAGVERFVFSGVYHPTLTSLSNHREKQPVERALYESGLPFVILQPAMFMSQLDAVVEQARRDGAIDGPYSAESPMAYVDYADVADAAAEAFLTDRLLNGTFELAGPGMFSRRDLAHHLTDLLGRPVQARVSHQGRPAGQVPDDVRKGLSRMFEHYDRHGFRGGNSLVLTAVLGREPMTVPRYLAEAVAREEDPRRRRQ